MTRDTIRKENVLKSPIHAGMSLTQGEDVTLLEIPYQKVSVEPGDVIVLMPEMELSSNACQNIIATVKQKFPDNEILILDEDMKIGVIEKGKTGE